MASSGLNTQAPRFRAIRDDLLDQIATGKLAPGQRLPAMRQMAEEAGVAYETLCRAIRGLVAEGVLKTEHGRGTWVSFRGPQRGKRTGAVGLVSQVPYDRLLGSPYFGRLVPLLQHELMERHEQVIHQRWSPETPMSEMFSHGQQVDGIAYMLHYDVDPGQVPLVEKTGLAVVSVGTLKGYIPGGENLCLVDSDSYSDSREAVARLIVMGHQRIAVFALTKHLRVQGYTQALIDAGIPYRPEYVISSENGAEALLERFRTLAERPTALFIANDMDQTPQIIEGLRAMGIEPGRDLYICSYDDDLWNNLAPLGIPYARVQQPIADIARVTAEVLLTRIEGKLSGPLHVFLRSRFIESPGRAV